MSETTTIEITKAQKAQLDDLKEHEKEPYKSVIERHISDEKPPTDDAEQLLDELADGIGMAADPGVSIQPEEFDEMRRDIEKVKELLERVPEETAEELGRKYA